MSPTSHPHIPPHHSTPLPPHSWLEHQFVHIVSPSENIKEVWAEITSFYECCSVLQRAEAISNLVSRVLQCVAACCSVCSADELSHLVKSVAVCCSVLKRFHILSRSVAACCSVLKRYYISLTDLKNKRLRHQTKRFIPQIHAVC